ncbi:hypothetical protein OIU77_011901 [Salix suchowensis]|uniref:Uncharacterized protein n=1 Tax=Salix suchowensis TaxID=1278906 RepID=A0ABQ9A1W3_9ROSI|nr:hypothetical protein OIU77_011901 [Salix suchowensis]
MESLTGLVNRTQRACTVLGEVKACLSGKLSRPLMLLVASSGKSSVSESVVGRDFLPRGSEVVALNMSSSRGSFTDSIPTSLGSAQIPRSLHLQRNSFQGQLPASLMKPRYM